MMRRIGLIAPLLLAACEPSAPRQPDDAGQAEPSTVTQDPLAEQEPAVTPPMPGDPPPVALPRLPINTGVYVIAGTSCINPANAAFRIYDGTGISGSATRDCRLENLRNLGDRYSSDQSCVDTYSGERSSYPIEVEVTGPDSFALGDGDETTRFVHCADEDVPEFLKG